MKSCTCTAVGKKAGVAVTGIILYGFVVMHMIGNLKAFKGVDSESGIHKLDLYGEWLREMGAPMFGHSEALWLTRIVLLLALLTHLSLVFCLTMRNRAARPIGYQVNHYGASTISSRTMAISGLGILTFLIYHIFHLTIGSVHYQGFVEGAVYHNIVTTFQQPLIVGVYVGAVLLLGFHLYHGVWSLFQTLGLTNSSVNCKYKLLATISALAVAGGFAAVPLSVLFGVLTK